VCFVDSGVCSKVLRGVVLRFVRRFTFISDPIVLRVHTLPGTDHVEAEAKRNHAQPDRRAAAER